MAESEAQGAGPPPGQGVGCGHCQPTGPLPPARLFYQEGASGRNAVAGS